MSDNVFQSCQAQYPDAEQSVLLECISNTLEGQADAKNQDLIAFLYVLAGAMIFFMQSGFAMLCAGSVRVKNVQNTMLKNLLDACGAAVAFYTIGECPRNDKVITP
jgi:Amt family ammonium transporter